MNNRTLLIIIGVIALAAFTILLIEVTKEPKRPITNSISDIIDSADEGLKEFKEEVKDEIDDNTDAR